MDTTQLATFSALAEPTRMRIIDMLAASGALSAGEISSRFNSTAAAVSQHLQVLRQARLVTVEKRAKQRIYQLDAQTMQQAEQWLRVRTQQWNDRFDALDTYLQHIP